MPPLLEVMTRTYRRPKMLLANRESLLAQTCGDWVQTFLPDFEGRGIGWSHLNLAARAPHLVGDYIWVLDDDDMCIRQTLVGELRGIVDACAPDVVMVKMDHGPLGVLPGDTWGKPPVMGGIGCSAFIVKRQVWQAHAGSWGNHYAGDYDFIAAVFADKPSVVWHDVVASRVQRISRGESE